MVMRYFLLMIVAVVLVGQSVLAADKKPLTKGVPTPKKTALSKGAVAENLPLRVFLREFYLPIAGHKLHAVAGLENVKISFKVKRDMTKEEAINFFDKLLLQNGIAQVMSVRGNLTTFLGGGSLDVAIQRLKRQIIDIKRLSFFLDDPDALAMAFQRLVKLEARLSVFEE